MAKINIMFDIYTTTIYFRNESVSNMQRMHTSGPTAGTTGISSSNRIAPVPVAPPTVPITTSNVLTGGASSNQNIGDSVIAPTATRSQSISGPTGGGTFGLEGLTLESGAIGGATASSTSLSAGASSIRTTRFMMEGVGARVIRGPDWKWGKQVRHLFIRYTILLPVYYCICV